MEVDRTLEALQRIPSLRSPKLEQELTRGDIDSAVSAVLLFEGIDQLHTDGGVPLARLFKKLRTGEPWATWAEIRVAVSLLTLSDGDVHIELEPGAARGRHPDWAFTYADTQIRTPIEVKAVGLSNSERRFCQHYAPQLKGCLPQVGFMTGHASIDVSDVTLLRTDRRESKRQARRSRRSGGELFGHLTGLRGATFVAHDSEGEYRRRIARKVADAARQLPEDTAGWVAFHWSNGAPIASCAQFIDWQLVPPHVEGVLFVGQAVSMPDPNIHCYAAPVPRSVGDDFAPVVQSIEGEVMTDLASATLARFEVSAGVRPTLLQAGRYRLLYRDGSRPILPFNLLIDVDPPRDAFESPGPPWHVR